LIAETLAKNKKVWIDVMMVEELGLMSVDENPIKDALVTFISFLFFGVMPSISLQLFSNSIHCWEISRL